jgi:TonB family protein
MPRPSAQGRGARQANQLTSTILIRHERGRVTAVSLIKSFCHSLLDEGARTAVQRWIFRPARRDGKPVAAQVDVPVRFRLDRSKKGYPSGADRSARNARCDLSSYPFAGQVQQCDQCEDENEDRGETIPLVVFLINMEEHAHAASSDIADD